MSVVLTVIAVILAIVGVINVLQGDFLWGIILLVLAAAVGPGGWTVYRGRG